MRIKTFLFCIGLWFVLFISGENNVNAKTLCSVTAFILSSFFSINMMIDFLGIRVSAMEGKDEPKIPWINYGIAIILGLIWYALCGEIGVDYLY
jgi:hypothetical protein